MFIWTQEHLITLKRMWAADVTASKIAKHLGTTRNSVVGKVHRLGLPGRLHPIANHAHYHGEAKPKAKRQPRATQAQARGVRLSIIKATTVPVTRQNQAPVVLHPTHKCRWITTDDRPWVFCDSPCQDGSSYCPSHHARAYQPKIQQAAE